MANLVEVPPAPSLPPALRVMGRGQVIRRLVVFQLKLMLDGLKDVALSPLSLVIAAIGVCAPQRGEAAWHWLFAIGRRFDAWVDMFPEPQINASPGGADRLLAQAEEIMLRLRSKGASRAEVQAELRRILDLG